MIQFLPALGVVKTFWANSKWLLLVFVLIGSHFVAYTAGQKNILREQTELTSGVVKEVTEKGVASVKQAGEDTARVKDLENDNERLTREFEALANRVACPLTDDELRFLESIQDSTEQ